MKKINVITLGCAKNRVDSEHLAAQFLKAGYEIVFDSDDPSARIVVINTCGFIGDAKQESIDTILAAADSKAKGHIDRLFVIGCLSERYADELRSEIPEVDQYFGARDLSGIARILEAEMPDTHPTERLLSTPKHYAYLKISEGCNWRCGYCAIPLIRGKHVSVPFEKIIEEASTLARNGVKELLVIAQDTTYYGMDLYGKRRLGELLESLCRIDGIEWIRLHYAYPTDFPQEVIDVMAREEKICKYIDLPLQHISDNMLSLMHRRHTKAQALELLSRLRKAMPQITIRTTLLVGYPNENAEDFEELKEFVRTQKFDRLGVFPYSEEEGTFSAQQLEDNVPQRVKEYRANEIMRIQNEVSLLKNRAQVGQTMRVIVDERVGDYYEARSEADSPEVDNTVLIPVQKGKRLLRGHFYQVRITAADDYDLYAEVLKK